MSKFFELFEAGSANTVKAAQVLNEMVHNWTDIEAKVKHLDDLEHAGDSITHRIMELLNRSFITPFDREDIVSLAHSIDDVTDFMLSAAKTMFFYQVDGPDPRAGELTEVILQATTEVDKGISLLRQRSGLKRMQSHCVEINRLENVADDIYRPAMAELFEKYSNVAMVIKWREIYENLESATDRCEDVADVLEGIALKHA